MANHNMQYGSGRGIEYGQYFGVIPICPCCGLKGYMELWYTLLNSLVFSVRHVRYSKRTHKNKTSGRCWI